MATLAQAFRERFISSADTVALFVDMASAPARFEWAETWRGRLVDFLSDNDINAPSDVLEVTRGLSGPDCAHRMGGAAAPIFELRLIAQAL